MPEICKICPEDKAYSMKAVSEYCKCNAYLSFMDKCYHFWRQIF